MINLVLEQTDMVVAKGTEDNSKITTKNFDKHVEQKVKMFNFKTPLIKKKQADDSEDDDISLNSEDPIENTSTFKYNPLPFCSLLKLLDERIKYLRDTLTLLLKWKNQNRCLQLNSALMLKLCLKL